MQPEDLQRELDRLWAKVTDSASPGPPQPSMELGGASSPVREASIEAIHLLKRQRREEEAGWQEMLALKETAVRDLSERLKAAQREILELRRRENQKESAAYSQVFELSARLEEAGRALKLQEEGASKEERALRDILQKTREQLAAETARWRELERQWNDREQHYLLELKEAQALLARAQEDAGRHEEKGRKLLDDLKQAKTAVEATLAELLSERNVRQAADADRDKALKKAAEVEEHFRELQNIWEEERKQWQQLWDRERSTWETQRQELAGWEERLRGEREAWHAQLKRKEEQELRFASQMTETLRQSSESGSKIAKIFHALAGVPDLAQAARARPKAARYWGLAAAAVLAGTAVYPVWRQLNRLQFALLSSQELSLENPTAEASDGGVLWLAEWSGTLVSVDPANPSHVLARHQVRTAGAYHPVSLAVGGDALWSLDAAQGRILKHKLSDPSMPQDSWPTPGPGPAALAHDGRNLWSYDAVTKTVYKHMGEGAGAEVVSFTIEGDIVPADMDWLGGRLWILDAKSGRVFRYVLSDKSFRLADSAPLDPAAVSISLHKDSGGRRQVWALTVPGRGVKEFMFKRFQVQP